MAKHTAAMDPKIFRAPNSPTIAATCPARMFATNDEASHTPISIDVRRAGESRETIDRPIGERHSSPKVEKRYMKSIHRTFAFTSSELLSPL